MKMYFFLILALSFFNCVGCGTVAVDQPKITTEKANIKNETEEQVGQSASFEPDTLFALMVAEIAFQRNQYEVALANYLHQAFKTRDANVIRRAVELAQYSGSNEIISEIVRLWTEVEPNSIEARQVAAVQAIKVKQFQLAIEHMQAVLSLNGATDFGYLALSANDLDDASRTELINAYTVLLKDYPNHKQLLFGYAVLLQQNKQYDIALKVSEKLLKQEKTNLHAILLNAQLLHQMKQSGRSLKKLEAALKIYPDEKRLRVLYARIFVDENRLDEAQEQFAILVNKSPEDGELILSMSLVAIDNQAYGIATEYLHRLIDIKQYQDEAYYYLGRIAEEQQQLDSALTFYKQVNNGSSVLPAYGRVVKILANRKQFHELQTQLSNARSIYSNQAIDFFLLESDVLIEYERYDAVQSLLKTAIAKYPENIDLLYARAMLSEKLADIQGLERDLRLAIVLEPNNPVLLNALGYTLTDLTDRHQEALKLINQAIALDPENPAIIDSLGWVHYRLGNHEKALKYLHQAFKFFPDHEVAAHLGEVLWFSGEHAEAEKVWKEGLKEKPDSDVIKNTIKRLKPAHTQRMLQ